MFEIYMKQSGQKYYRYDADGVCDFLERKGYDEILLDNGIPVSIEVQGWCELAYIGEEFEHNDFIVTCIDD